MWPWPTKGGRARGCSPRADPAIAITATSAATYFVIQSRSVLGVVVGNAAPRADRAPVDVAHGDVPLLRVVDLALVVRAREAPVVRAGRCAIDAAAREVRAAAAADD